MRSLERSSIDEVPKKRTQRGTSLRKLSGQRVEVTTMDVAPHPRFATLKRRKHRVPRRIEMREGVSVFRILAASDMTAGETYAELVPGFPERKALLAAVRAGFDVLYLAKMFTTIVHVRNYATGCDAKQLAALD
jgi:hypothetical protein